LPTIASATDAGSSGDGDDEELQAARSGSATMRAMRFMVGDLRGTPEP
jgi:hypothetical protein